MHRIIALVAVALLPLAAGAEAVPLVFEAEGDRLGLYPDDVLVAAHDPRGRVEVRLHPEATGSLAALTAAHVGEEIVIRFCGRELLRPRLMMPLDEGRFVLGGRVGAEGPAIVAILNGEADCALPAS